ncbi:MAG: hypothetical protein IJ068_03100 [Bacilli bacterium]|nr:hypothetical protein [Bacilli bacterium]
MKIYDLYWFIGTFLVVYLFYLFHYVIGKKKKYNPDKVPQELLYLIRKYKLDMKEINYKKVMNQIGLICAFDIAFTSTFMFMFVKKIYFSILIGAVMLVPLIIITFDLLGRYYKKKGIDNNGNKKD